MTHAQHLQSAFAAAFSRHTALHKTSYQSLIPFLHVPLRERLVLLCLLDGLDSRDMEAIKTALPYAKETDIRLTSHRMGAALLRLDEAFVDPWVWVDPEGEPERQLRQIFYACVPIMLFGEGVPAQIATLDVQTRLILYLLTVEEAGWSAIQDLLGCSEWSIRRAIKDAEAVLETI